MEMVQKLIPLKEWCNSWILEYRTKLLDSSMPSEQEKSAFCEQYGFRMRANPKSGITEVWKMASEKEIEMAKSKYPMKKPGKSGGKKPCAG
jgi:hypothetical protein